METDAHEILIDFLTYLYENNIDIRDEKNNWQEISKKFRKEHGYLTNAEIRAYTKLSMTQGVYSHTDEKGKRWYK